MHINILQGSRSGGVDTPTLNLSRVINQSVVNGVVLEYVSLNQLNLTRVVNVNIINDVELEDVVVSTLTQTRVTNTNTFGAISLTLVAFVPVNTETTALFAAYTGTYGTTTKRQVDTLISLLKSEGIWAGLDWYGNANWAVNEHDALLNWKDPSQTLVKVGAAFWTLGAGLSGVNPMTASGRYKSNAAPAGGPNSSATSFAFFTKITAIVVPQVGMQPMGNFELSSPGPAAPDGSFFTISPGSTGSAGANVLPFNGNTGFACGDGTGVWGVSRSGGTNITVHNGTTIDSDSVSGNASYHNAEGMCVVGTPPGFGAQRSFPGTELYWGWGAAMTEAMFAAVETSFETALLPPDVGDGAPDDSLLTDGDEDWLAVNGDDYLATQ